MTNEKPKPTVLAIIGPTACGKTEASLSMARQHDGAVVSADSRQVYTGMNIGTAKPSAVLGPVHEPLSPDLIAGIDHYLFNIRLPNAELTLSEWREAAYQSIDHIVTQGKLPIIAGGTMLYTDSVINNYTLPNVPADPEFRLRKSKESTNLLYDELLSQDPAARDFIEPTNKRRIVRALEVINATGSSFSSQRTTQTPRYEIAVHGVFPGWEILESRIKRRVQTMLDEGLIAETKGLIETYGPELQLLHTINYAQAVQVINGELEEDDAPKEMEHANLRYAKRQMSWWKRYENISWHNTATDLNNSVIIS